MADCMPSQFMSPLDEIQTPTFLGVLTVAVLHISRHIESWIREARRSSEIKELRTLCREAVQLAQEAAIQSASSNRKAAHLQDSLEERGMITPDPLRGTRRSELDPVTIITKARQPK
jgi:hypothetical protein